MTTDATLLVRRSGPLRGACRVPGDKSISHRALLFGALCDGPVEIDGLGLGGDNVSTANALRALGVDIALASGRARVEGVGFQGLRAPAAGLDCGNSGTTIRMLMGLLAGRPFDASLDGDASLRRRPMGRVAEPLRRMGALVEGTPDPARPGNILPPLRVRGGALRGIDCDLPVASAQLKTALVLAGLQARGATRLREPGPSRDHSERMLRHLGAPLSVAADGRTIVVDPGGWDGRLRAAPLSVPGDLSSAAFLLVAAAAIPGSHLTVEGVGLNPTRTGVLDVLRAMGADLDVVPRGDAMGEPWGRVTVRGRALRATEVAGEMALRALDEIPALAVAAALAEGRSLFSNLHELRIKESDRIRSIARELTRAGVAVEEREDGMAITGTGGGPVRGGRVEPDHDHRIAMAGAVLGLCAEGTTEVPAADIATSFPTFAVTLRALGAAL